MQSRYYNPKTSRFINVDGLVSSEQGFFGNNLFAYCFNNPCRYVDPLGCEGIVGIGFQTEVSTNCGMCGVEIVIYFDKNVIANTLDDESANFAIALYSYSGVSIDIGSLTIAPSLMEMALSLDLSKLDKMSTDELLITLVALLSDFELSGSLFVIYGYDNFVNADSYSGHFDSWSMSLPTSSPSLNIGGYVSYSDTCFVVGVKTSVRPPKTVFAPKIEYSRTYYSKATLLRP